MTCPGTCESSHILVAHHAASMHHAARDIAQLYGAHPPSSHKLTPHFKSQLCVLQWNLPMLGPLRRAEEPGVLPVPGGESRHAAQPQADAHHACTRSKWRRGRHVACSHGLAALSLPCASRLLVILCLEACLLACAAQLPPPRLGDCAAGVLLLCAERGGDPLDDPGVRRCLPFVQMAAQCSRNRIVVHAACWLARCRCSLLTRHSAPAVAPFHTTG